MAPESVVKRAKWSLPCVHRDNFVAVTDPYFANGKWMVMAYCGKCPNSISIEITDREHDQMHNDTVYFQNQEY